MRRSLALVLTAALTVCPAELFGQFAETAPTDRAVKQATALCVPGQAKLVSGILGISDPHAKEPAVIDLIAKTGVNWVRAEFHWSQIQPVVDGAYQWKIYDQMVNDYNKLGISILAILTYIPDSQPRDWGAIDVAYTKFATAAVKRYSAKGVHYWEVFNEPNLPGYGWLTQRQDAAKNLSAYTLLLARTNKIVRANDPSGVVVIGGIASDQGRGLTAEDTMKRIYALGGKDCFDIMAFHPYGYQNNFPEARKRINAILRDGKDKGKPVWFNEYGWTDQAAMDLKTNPTKKTNPLLAALSQRKSADALFWFAAKDYSSKRGTPSFGLATYDLKLRPSFVTFRKYVKNLSQ